MNWWIFAVCAVAFIVLLLVLIANIELDMYLAPYGFWGKFADSMETDGGASSKAEEERKANQKALFNKVTEWYAEDGWQELTVDSMDKKASLYARVKLQEKHTNRWLVAVHGYKGNLVQSGCYGINYFTKGYNVLIPNMRAHEKSTGKFAGMGFLEKDDMLVWMKEILKRDPMAEIVFHGESMGAATLMMMSGENLPENVKAFVCDCGFSSMWEQFCFVKKNVLHLPVYPVMPIASFFCRLRLGFFFGQASCTKALERCKTPILFFHGDKDGFVPKQMLYKNYGAVKDCPKDWYMFSNADHCCSKFVEPELYWIKVWDFLENHVK